MTKVVAAAPSPGPLAIAPAASGSNTLVVCPDGSEETLVAGRWAAGSRGEGAAVTVCPPGLLVSQAKSTGGSYDFVVVEQRASEEGAENGGGVDGVLGEVSRGTCSMSCVMFHYRHENVFFDVVGCVECLLDIGWLSCFGCREEEQHPSYPCKAQVLTLLVSSPRGALLRRRRYITLLELMWGVSLHAHRL